MKTYRCEPKFCSKKDNCNHHITKPVYSKLIREDLSDICLPDFRLYIEGNRPRAFSCKRYYIELLNFYDNECCGENCGQREPYDNSKIGQSSRTECKLCKDYNCLHPKHPVNVAMNMSLSIIEAEEEAFEKAGIDEGRVTYTCPICSGEAAAVRYIHDGWYHGLGSGCKKCGTYHT